MFPLEILKIMAHSIFKWNRLNRLSLLGWVLWTALFLTPFQVWGQSSREQADRIKALSDDLRCPTCQGLSVKDSEAGFSVNIRNKAAEMVRQGYTDDEIKDYFVQRYGEWILRIPPMRGFNLLLWILPGAGILIGFWYVFQKTRRWAHTHECLYEEVPEELNEEEQRQVDADLQRFRGF